MIKLIASDLDGTLIGSSNLVPKANIEAITHIQKNNIPLVICTGKTFAISKEICKNLNADFGIFGNGSQIIDLKTGKEILNKTLSTKDLEPCFDVIKKYNLHVHAYTDVGIITPKPEYMDLRNFILFSNRIKLEIVDSVFNKIKEKQEPIFKLIVSSPFHLDKAKSDLLNLTNLSITHITKTGMYKDTIIDKEYEYLDISPKNVTKGNALDTLCKYLNLSRQNILSIGDNLNDINMFKVSNISAAVCNAHEKVKKASNYITNKSAENGAFAEAVYKFVQF